LNGDNVTTKSERMPWHAGPALLQLLENVPVDSERLAAQPFRMAVQWVNRPNLDFRGFSGWIESGTVRPGDTIRILPSGRASRIQSIVTFGGKLPHAVAGQSVTLTLSDEVDCSRGDLIVASDAPLEVADQFEATIVWMDEQEMLPGRPYRFKLGASVATATITKPKYQIDVDNIAHVAADTLALNAIGVCNLSLDRPIPFDAYENNPDLGGFILIDRITNRTVAAGMIHFALRRSHNIHWQSIDIGRDSHSAQKNQKPALLWFTGLSGSGKSTIANLVERKLFALGKHSFLLDGDNIRHGLNRDLGFTDADRVENIRRVGEAAKLFVDAGLIVLTAFISPFRSERDLARSLLKEGEFIEIFVDTPLEVCIQRDPKGLYEKAKAGEIKNFTGIDSPYEAPEIPELHIETMTGDAATHAAAIVARLRERGYIS
jgi:bifunctional enzyme CysN/CysC